MKRLLNMNIRRYIKGNYIIYISLEDNEYNYYLQHKDYGVIQHYLGMLQTDITEDKFMEIVENSVDRDIEDYKKMYED